MLYEYFGILACEQGFHELDFSFNEDHGFQITGVIGYWDVSVSLLPAYFAEGSGSAQNRVLNAIQQHERQSIEFALKNLPTGHGSELKVSTNANAQVVCGGSVNFSDAFPDQFARGELEPELTKARVNAWQLLWDSTVKAIQAELTEFVWKHAKTAEALWRKTRGEDRVVWQRNTRGYRVTIREYRLHDPRVPQEGEDMIQLAEDVLNDQKHIRHLAVEIYSNAEKAHLSRFCKTVLIEPGDKSYGGHRKRLLRAAVTEAKKIPL